MKPNLFQNNALSHKKEEKKDFTLIIGFYSGGYIAPENENHKCDFLKQGRVLYTQSTI